MNIIYLLIISISILFIKNQGLNLLGSLGSLGSLLENIPNQPQNNNNKSLLQTVVDLSNGPENQFMQTQNYSNNYNPGINQNFLENDSYYRNYSQEILNNQYQVNSYNQGNNDSFFQQNQNSNINKNNIESTSLIPLVAKVSQKGSSLVTTLLPLLSGGASKGGGEGGSTFNLLFSTLMQKRKDRKVSGEKRVSLLNRLRNRFKKNKVEDKKALEIEDCDCFIIEIDYQCVVYKNGKQKSFRNTCLTKCEKNVKRITRGKCIEKEEKIVIKDIIKEIKVEDDIKKEEEILEDDNYKVFCKCSSLYMPVCYKEKEYDNRCELTQCETIENIDKSIIKKGRC